MKSNQLNFFIAPADLAAIDAFFADLESVVIKGNVSVPKVYSEYSIMGAVAENVFQVYLSATQFLENVEFKQLEQGSHYYIFDRTSEVVQFSIGGVYPYSAYELHRSRLYFIKAYYDSNGVLVLKNEEFLGWANQLLKEFKKKFLMLSTQIKGAYLSSEANDWVNRNDARLSKDGLKFSAIKDDDAKS